MTCKSKRTGKPLAVFDSEADALSFMERKGIENQIPYECRACQKWHLSPKERHTPSVHCDACGKALYQTEQAAEQRAHIIGTSLRVYECPYGEGWHLTSKGA